MIALSACPPHRRPSIGPTRKRAYARREASSAKTAVNEALTLYLIRATHQMVRPLIHNLHFCNCVLYSKGFSSRSRPCDCLGSKGRLLAPWVPGRINLALSASWSSALRPQDQGAGAKTTVSGAGTGVGTGRPRTKPKALSLGVKAPLEQPMVEANAEDASRPRLTNVVDQGG